MTDFSPKLEVKVKSRLSDAQLDQVNKIKKAVFDKNGKYNFIYNNEHLKDNIILLGLGGSYAYGTNVESSDIDIRGCALNSKEEILTNKNFEQFIDNDTDTTIYSFNKLAHLLSNCNPNTIEILGLEKEHYLYIAPEGYELLNNKDLFLSKKAYNTFVGYAYSQLRRLDNKSNRNLNQTEQETHILNSINNFRNTSKDRYLEIPEDSINLYVDTAVNDCLDSEIFMDIHLTHYPLRDYKNMWSEMNNIVKEYAKLGRRNNSAIKRGALAKHMMHLIRLYLMCDDILLDGKIITFRKKENSLLMDIRDGKYLDDDYQPTDDFMEMVEYYQNKLKKSYEISDLPEVPDYDKINHFIASINEKTVLNR